jgi:hypothetical protein
MMKKGLLFIAVAAILTGCAQSVRIYSDLENTASFESYQTYTFLDFTDGNKKTITGMELERIRVAFAREIEQKGLSFSEDRPDLTVQITVYHREALDRGYYYAPSRSYMERAIAVDFFDTRTKKHVWHCAAVGELTYDPTERSQNLPEVAKAIFEKYPMQPAS